MIIHLVSFICDRHCNVYCMSKAKQTAIVKFFCFSLKMAGECVNQLSLGFGMCVVLSAS